MKRFVGYCLFYCRTGTTANSWLDITRVHLHAAFISLEDQVAMSWKISKIDHVSATGILATHGKPREAPTYAGFPRIVTLTNMLINLRYLHTNLLVQVFYPVLSKPQVILRLDVF